MKIKRLYLNLPVLNIQKTREFWNHLGFEINEKFSDEKALCVIMKEDAIFAMLIAHEFFSTFTNRPIADGSTTQVLIAIEMESKEQVHEVVRKALELGATRYLDPIDEGWMFYERFVDIDGHQWEVTYMDESLMLPLE